MSTKGEKTSPICIHEEVFRMCDVEQEPLLAQLMERLQSCKTIFEQMNCFGILKQEISSFKDISLTYRGFCFSKYSKVYCTCLYSSFLSATP